SFRVTRLVQMRDQLDVVGSDGEEAASSLGDAVAAIVIDIDVEPVRLQEAEVAGDLVGEHGVPEGHDHIPSGPTAPRPAASKLVAAGSAVVLSHERDRLEASDASEAGRVRPAGKEMVESGEQSLGPDTTDGTVLEVTDPDAILDGLQRPLRLHRPQRERLACQPRFLYSRYGMT